MKYKFKKIYDPSKRITLKRLEEYQDEIMSIMQATRELEEFSPEIGSVIEGYNKKSCDKTMMIKGVRKSNQETTNRRIHQDNVATVAKRIAQGMNEKYGAGLNCGIIDIMGRNHDIGHTPSGHNGEWWLSNIKEDYGMGYYCHNALGPRELIYTNKVYDKIMDEIKKRHPEIGEKKLSRIKGSLWIIMEAINSHNGEMSEREYRPDLTKKESDFERELLCCYTKKGFDRTILPGTPEGSLMRICDKISYIPYDMVDGLREGIITQLNDEYKVVLRGLGITDEEIEECQTTKQFEPIAEKLQSIFINDVINNSTGTVIRMSKETSKLMHKLRSINNKQIVNWVVLQEDNDTYPPAIKEFLEEFKQIILENNLIQKLNNGKITLEERQMLMQKYSNTPYEGFLTYLCNTNQDDFAYTKKIVVESTKQSIVDEQNRAREIVQNGEPFIISPDFSMKDKRIQKYINYYKNTQYDEESIKKDARRIWLHILNPNKKSKLYLGMDERIAIELGAKYLATLSDTEFIELLRNSGKIDEKQFASLTRAYKDIPDLHEQVYIQPNWKRVSEAQEKSSLEEK